MIAIAAHAKYAGERRLGDNLCTNSAAICSASSWIDGASSPIASLSLSRAVCVAVSDRQLNSDTGIGEPKRLRYTGFRPKLRIQFGLAPLQSK